MAGISDLFTVLQKIRSTAQNLSKDVDPADSREETGGDLNDLTSGFAQLQTLFQSLNQSDMQKIQAEVKELMSGQQNFREYARDVNALLAEVRNRTQQNKEMKKKIKKNIPVEHKNKDPDDFFGGLKGILDEVSSWSEKVASK
ncbi:MAG: hypothetical protein WB791_01895 [Waddliaceae bacterium]